MSEEQQLPEEGSPVFEGPIANETPPPALLTGNVNAAPQEDSSSHNNSNGPLETQFKGPTAASLLLSTALSLAVVLVLLVSLRFLLPSMLEFSRYSWLRGQLRAEYEIAGQQLERISLDGISSVSQSVARRVCPSVVHITMDSSKENSSDVSFEDIARVDRSRRSLVGQGSGVIVDPRGYILTNFHVISDEKGRINPNGRINVTISDERNYKAELIGVDSATDLALIKIAADELLPISWGDSECLEVGSPVWAVGSPFGLSGSITFGILSSKHRLDLSGTKYDERRPRQNLLEDTQFNPHLSPRYSDLMQSDVAVNPGNSGGPLVNGRGELIGINTAIIGTAYQGVSFSIPSNVAKLVFEQLLETGKIRRGWLGVELVKVSDWEKQIAVENDEQEESEQVAQGPRKKGAVIRRIISTDSPAAIAGLKVGDWIKAVNGQSIKGVEDLIFTIGKSPVGSAIELTLERDGETTKVDVIIGERPDVQ